MSSMAKDSPTKLTLRPASEKAAAIGVLLIAAATLINCCAAEACVGALPPASVKLASSSKYSCWAEPSLPKYLLPSDS